MVKVICAEKNCCTADRLFKPERGLSIETQQGTFVVCRSIRSPLLRLPYGNQSRKVEWYLAGKLDGEDVEITLVCARVVRAKPPTHARIGEAGSQPIRTEEDD